MPASSGSVRSPVATAASNPATSPPSPLPQRAKFDAALLRAYMKKLLASTLTGATWPEPREKDRLRLWCREIGERVKQRAVEMEPRGFKFMVTTQINENLGQGGRADLACHWEDSDAVAQEIFANDSLICVCIAFAIRTA